MIHYHGAPIWPTSAAAQFFARRHAWVSFAHTEQMPLVAEVCQSFVSECDAFPRWQKGEGRVDVPAYAAWVREWQNHPGFDFAIVPDVIDGSEFDNDQMIAQWLSGERMRCRSVPVWHLHESFERLRTMIRGVHGGVWERIAIGSSGKWATPGSQSWWERMDEVRDVVCDEDGRPVVRLHGLRMLSPTIFSHIPLASADSCNVALNIGKDVKWKGTYQPITELQRAFVMAERIEMHGAATRWSRRAGVQQNFELIG